MVLHEMPYSWHYHDMQFNVHIAHAERSAPRETRG